MMQFKTKCDEITVFCARCGRVYTYMTTRQAISQACLPCWLGQNG
jgi:hypothetical protein